MKTSLSIFFAILLLTNCTGKTTPSATREPATVTTQPVLEEEQEPEWLIIGGQKVDNLERSRQYEHYLKSEAETITRVMLLIVVNRLPVNIDEATSLEGVEQLVNLQELTIVGWGIDELDFSPLNHLHNLNHITFSSGANAKLTKIPDLNAITSRESITSIEFSNCALTNLNNIEFLTNLREIEIVSNADDLTDINALRDLQHIEMLKIYSEKISIYGIKEQEFLGHIGSKPKLKKLLLSVKQVDAKVIENFNSLEEINFLESNVINTKYLSELRKVEYLQMMIREPVPDIEFLKGMENLKRLVLYAPDSTWGRKEDERFPVLDLGPIGNLSQLNYLELWGFILQNVAALNKLDNLEQTLFAHSVLKDSSEISSKKLIFHPDAPNFTPVWGINEW
ncbi:MAG: hypothetical protein LBQ89_08925 [Treponema sp.]|jgi:hypothetical protein|nr:hypothetical protein [Treponema sp.]